MRKTMPSIRVLTGLLTLIVWTAAAAAQTAVREDVARRHAIFIAEMEKIHTTERAGERERQDAYLRALGALERQFQERGHLEPLLRIQAERTRFADELISVCFNSF